MVNQGGDETHIVNLFSVGSITQILPAIIPVLLDAIGINNNETLSV
jgi:hypothetical protein